MKRTYKTPKTHVVNIELTHMIAMSTRGTTLQTSGNLSREQRNSGWDDDYEDD